MPRRQESDSPFGWFQSCSHWLRGGQGAGRAGDWKSIPGGAGLLGGEGHRCLITADRQPFLTSWHHTLAHWLVFALALRCSPPYLCGELETQRRRAGELRAPSAESGLEPKTPSPSVFCFGSRYLPLDV